VTSLELTLLYLLAAVLGVVVCRFARLPIRFMSDCSIGRAWTVRSAAVVTSVDRPSRHGVSLGTPSSADLVCSKGTLAELGG